VLLDTGRLVEFSWDDSCDSVQELVDGELEPRQMPAVPFKALTAASGSSNAAALVDDKMTVLAWGMYDGDTPVAPEPVNMGTLVLSLAANDEATLALVA
jgi:hypothetical protein